jgi:L-threonylcarbamoyladenylate synthase
MIQTEIGTDLKKAKLLLDASEIISIPTETVYGLAGNGKDPLAIQKIYAAKRRPLSNPLILHYKNVSSAFSDITSIPKDAETLAKKFWPGPLTMLLPKNNNIPDAVTAGKHRVAIRVPQHELCLALLNTLDYPIAAPSANLYGRISPTSPSHVHEQLNSRIPYILDGGICQKGLESTIIGFEKDTVVIYRLGSISIEAIEACLQKKVQLINKIDTNQELITSGMVKHHYAPNTPMYALADKHKEKNLSNCGFIGFDTFDSDFPSENQFLLSKMGDLETAAKELYRSFHVMDGKRFKSIYIEFLPERGIGRAVNDRINRAIKKYTA